MILYIVRHAQSVGNVTGDTSPDPILSHLGEKQAELLGKRFGSIPLKSLISSPLQRALATADAVARHQPKGGAERISVIPELMEFGTPPDYKGLETNELSRQFVRLNSFTQSHLGNEDDNTAFARAKRIIDRITSLFSQGEQVMIVSHGTFNQYLISAALGLESKADFVFCQLNTAVTKITFNENSAALRLTYMDDVSHLLPEYPDLFDNI